MPAGAKPGERRGGRAKGRANKITRELREMILAALDGVGGQKYLQQQANDNPGPFLTLLGKCLPKDVIIDKTVRHESTLSDAELERIALAGSARIAAQAESARESGGVH